MATIIAASFQLQSQAENTVEKLIRAGFASEKVSSFYVNPPGQHALYPIGGDHYQSPAIAGKEGNSAPLETAFAEVAEAVIGVQHDKDSSVDTAPINNTIGSASTDTKPSHRAGMMVAVEVAGQADQDKVVALLTQLDAHNIEKAEGEIVDGEWLDFDPFSEPRYL